MAGLLSFLAGLNQAGMAADTGRMEGAGIRRKDERQTMLDQLARERQTAQDAQETERMGLLNQLTQAQTAKASASEVGGSPTYGTGLHEVIDPASGQRVLVQASSAGGAQPVPFKPLPETSPRGPQGSPVQMVRDGKPVFFNPTTRETVAPPEGMSLPGSDRVSAATAVKVAENRAQMRTIEAALAEIDKYPGAIGPKRGIGKLPGLGGIADMVNQNVDPAGVDARLNIANVGSLLIHDRSGAAVSISEFPRLAPFVPDISDTPEAAKKKLRALWTNLEQIVNELDKGALLSDLRGGASAGVPRGTEQPPPGPANLTPFLPPRRNP